MNNSLRKRLVSTYLANARNHALMAMEKHGTFLPAAAYVAVQRAVEALLEAETRVLVWDEVPHVEPAEPEPAGTYRVLGTDTDGTRRVMASGMGYRAAEWFAENYLGSYYVPEVQKES